MSVNVNGLRGKIDALRLRAITENPDVIACQETKIGSRISSDSISINGYKLYRKDRNESGGGVAIYIKDSFNAVEIKSGISSQLELVAVKCERNNKDSSVIFGSMYRPPKSNIPEFIDSLSSFISYNGCLQTALIIGGDTNMCALSNEFDVLRDVCSNMKLTQVINCPTHNLRLIDQIFVSERVRAVSTGIQAPIENVHALTWTKLSLAPISNGTTPKINYWKFKAVDWQALCNELMMQDTLVRIMMR
jgi:exonuclease III